MIRKFLYFYLLFLLPCTILAQPLNQVGQWESHIPYNNAKAITHSEKHFFVANDLSLLSYNFEDLSVNRLDKTNGLSDMGISTIEFNEDYEILIIAYSNGNLDFLTNGGNVINRPAILNNENIQGNKSINHIYCDSNLIYLSAEFGLIEFNIENMEFGQSVFTEDIFVNASTILGDEIFMATNEGIFKINRAQSNLNDFINNWQKVDTSMGLSQNVYNSQALLTLNNEVYADMNDTIIRFDGTTWSHIPVVYNGNNIPYCYSGFPNLKFQADFYKTGFTIPTGFNHVIGFSPSNSTLINYYYDPAQYGLCYDAQFGPSSNLWTAMSSGLQVVRSTGAVEAIIPSSPYRVTVSDMAVDANGVLWCTGSPKTFDPEFDKRGIYQYKNREWTNYNNNTMNTGFFSHPDSVNDYVTVAIHPQNQNVYLGSFIHGLVVIPSNPDSSIRNYNQTNTVNGLNGDQNVLSQSRISGLAFDDENNLWIANRSAARPIVVLKEDGSWANFTAPDLNLQDIAIDRFGNKWFPLRGNLLVYDSGDDIDDPADDRYITLSPNNSELASSTVNSIVADRDGAIWAGTNDGVTIFNCNVFDNNCPGLRPVINPDDFNGRLLEAENVKAMAVDGANRIWVGTDNGVFQLDGETYEQLLYFNEENSPLFSNSISSIAAGGEYGQVYIATEKGLQAYRGKATEGKTFMDKSEVYVFPNPVRPGYDGYISIRGLAEDVNVKITDVSGDLVYEQTAFGGQAVWDGTNYLGQPAAAGVYLVFVVSDDASQKLVTKFIIGR